MKNSKNILEHLSKELLTDVVSMEKYVSTASYRYKIYDIPKRSGRGVRTIAQPSKELKGIQKLVLNKFLRKLPVHDSATAYVEGLSIADNARKHVGRRYLLKMDFADFFPSISPQDLISHVKNHISEELSASDRKCLENIFFYRRYRHKKRQLSIGAPSSPFISNSIMNEFDLLIHKKSSEDGVIYTRYADDLSFSTNNKGILFDYPKLVSDFLKQIAYPRIIINQSKTVFLSRAENMHVTGLVLTVDGRISIGRQKKRWIKSLVFQYTKNDISDDDKIYLMGYLAFCNGVEPEFLENLKKKYGDSVIGELFQKKGKGQ